MLTHIVLTGLLLGGGPDYTKKVMVDPNYKSTHTPQQIAAALETARKPRVVYRTRTEVVYRTEYRGYRKRDWVWPVVSVGLYTGIQWALWHNYGHRGHHHGHHRRHYRHR